MTRLSWDERSYESGLDRGVLYLSKAVPWNGLVSVTENPESDSGEARYFEGERHNPPNLGGSFMPKIVGFTMPKDFEPYFGLSDSSWNQTKKPFGLSYRTRVGEGYLIHLVYNATATLSSRVLSTLDETNTLLQFTWDLQTKPIRPTGFAPASHYIVDSRYANALALETLEEWLYGSDDQTPRLPPIDEVIDLFENYTVLQIIDHGDGTWTAIGPDEVVNMIDSTTFQISWPSAVYLDAETYQVSSL